MSFIIGDDGSLEVDPDTGGHPIREGNARFVRERRPAGAGPAEFESLSESPASGTRSDRRTCRLARGHAGGAVPEEAAHDRDPRGCGKPRSSRSASWSPRRRSCRSPSRTAACTCGPATTACMVCGRSRGRCRSTCSSRSASWRCSSRSPTGGLSGRGCSPGRSRSAAWPRRWPGNVGHIAGTDVASRVTAAVPPFAAAAALTVGLGVLKRVVGQT